MSVITCYARMTDNQLQSLDQSPDTLARLYMNVPPGGEVIDLDKAAEVIAWLLSPRKRAEQFKIASLINEDFGEKTRLEFDLKSTPPWDDLAICIEGRGAEKIKRLDVGYGPACVFRADELEKYTEVLDKVDESVMRSELDFELMDSMYLPVDYWREDGEAIFAQYIFPQFGKLQSFYRAAASAGQSVMVWNA